jgi:CheY-like chemotaxis protein
MEGQMQMSEARACNTFGSVDAAPKMLVADHDPSIVRLLVDRYTQMGFEVDTASNGVQALLKASHSKLDILVIDVNMPEVDGLSVCAHLSDRGKRPTHVVVVTGNWDPETLDRCERVGAFYARKGAAFWNDLEAALNEIYPDLEEGIRPASMRSERIDVRPRPRVLLVDDDADVKKFLGSRLEKYGVDLLYAGDATQGYRLACREEPTVVISDYFMPDGDAQYLLTKLRTTPVTADIPVIVISGRGLGKPTQQALKREICGHLGAAHILRKSMDASELFNALQPYCGFQIGPYG